MSEVKKLGNTGNGGGTLQIKVLVRSNNESKNNRSDGQYY